MGVSIPGDLNFANLDLSEPPKQAAGMDHLYQLVGSETVKLVLTEFTLNLTGVPDSPNPAEPEPRDWGGNGGGGRCEGRVPAGLVNARRVATRGGQRDSRRMSARDGLLTRYADKIVGVLGCYDRLVFSGTLTAIAYPEAMAGVLRREHIRCFDLAQYVEPIREQIRKNAERLAAEHGLHIQYLPKHDIRKEDIVAEVLAPRFSGLAS